jgi:hypothetical protein
LFTRSVLPPRAAAVKARKLVALGRRLELGGGELVVDDRGGGELVEGGAGRGAAEELAGARRVGEGVEPGAGAPETVVEAGAAAAHLLVLRGRVDANLEGRRKRKSRNKKRNISHGAQVLI